MVVGLKVVVVVMLMMVMVMMVEVGGHVGDSHSCDSQGGSGGCKVVVYGCVLVIMAGGDGLVSD